MMIGFLRGKSQIFKQILLSEELYSSPRVGRVPIDIESSFIGQDMNCLVDAISGVETIQPYCDTSLRVIIRIADVLMLTH